MLNLLFVSNAIFKFAPSQILYTFKSLEIVNVWFAVYFKKFLNVRKFSNMLNVIFKTARVFTFFRSSSFFLPKSFYNFFCLFIFISHLCIENWTLSHSLTHSLTHTHTHKHTHKKTFFLIFPNLDGFHITYNIPFFFLPFLN